MKALVGTIRKNTPLERQVRRHSANGVRLSSVKLIFQIQDNYVLLYKDISRARRYIGMSNQYIGYVFLIDENCKIRWTAHGIATPEEVANMIGMTKFLAEKRSAVAPNDTPSSAASDTAAEEK